MSDADPADNAIIDAFVSALQRIPSARAHLIARETPGGPDRGIDFVIEATVAARAITLLVAARTAAFPRDVRDVIWRLRAHTSQVASDGGVQRLPVLIADVISPGARAALRAGGVGYFDRSGSLFLPTPGAFVYIDSPQPKQARPTSSAIFFGRKAQVLSAIFERRAHWVSVKEIADVSGVSAATVSQTLMDLERRKWMQSRGGGPAKLRRLTDARAMIGTWATYVCEHRSPSAQLYQVPPAREDLPLRLAEVCNRCDTGYTVTGQAAAHIYNPGFAGPSRTLCRMVAGVRAKQALTALGARPVTEAWNLKVFETRSPIELAYGQTVGGVRLASMLQIYLDLLQGPEQDKNQAEFFRRERLGV